MNMDTALAAFLDTADPVKTLVASDFDGTLSSIVPSPDAAAPLPGALDALARLHRRTLGVAVISGRSSDDLRRLLPLPGLRLLGDYGRPAPTDAEVRHLEALDADLRAALSGMPGITVERKAGSASVHFRARPEAGPQVLERVRPLARAHGLDVHAGRRVVEVVLAGWTKARALRALVEELRPGALVFAGDDRGDRECFTYMRTLELPHLGVGVQSPETPVAVFEDCDLVVEEPEAAVEVFSRLAAAWDHPGRGRAGRAPGG